METTFKVEWNGEDAALLAQGPIQTVQQVKAVLASAGITEQEAFPLKVFAPGMVSFYAEVSKDALIKGINALYTAGMVPAFPEGTLSRYATPVPIGTLVMPLAN